ncbi:hypothetical protein EJ07DRAFT_152263 [Lizonia empirigonia]|nr:hypothetical protein EJ07DRAFT_152263 [Lizonia empirigonia]
MDKPYGHAFFSGSCTLLLFSGLGFRRNRSCVFASPVYRLKHECGKSHMIMHWGNYAVQALMQDPCNPSGGCASYDWQGLRLGWVHVSASLVFNIDASLPLQTVIEPFLQLPPGYVLVERILICLLGPTSAMTTGPPEKPEKWFLPSEGISLALSEAERIIGSEVRIWSERNKGINGHWVRPHTFVSEESRELKELREQSKQVLQTAVKRKKRSENERKATDDDLYQSTGNQRPPKIKSITCGLRSPSRPKQEQTESKSNQGPAVDSNGSKTLMAETKFDKRDVQRKDLSPLEALAESYGWQIDAEKFLWNDSEVPVNAVIKRRYLGKGSIGDVAEVNVEGYGMSMVRKRIEIGRARRNARTALVPSRGSLLPRELSESGQKHGSKSDVFSLGLVFVEMTVAWNKSISQLRNFVFDGQAEQYHQHLERLPLWFAEKSSSKGLSLWEACIKRMLTYERDERLSPQEVVDLLAQDQLRGIVKRSCVCQKTSSHVIDGEAIEKTKIKMPQRSSPKLADEAAVATGRNTSEENTRITKTSIQGARDDKITKDSHETIVEKPEKQSPRVNEVGTTRERPPRNSVTQTGNTTAPNTRSHRKAIAPKKVPKASRDNNQPEISSPGDPSNAASEDTPPHEAEKSNLDRLKDGPRTKRKAVEPSIPAVVKNRKASKVPDEKDPKARMDLARSPPASPGLIRAILAEPARTSTENTRGADATKQSQPLIHVRERSVRRLDTNGPAKAMPADDIDETVEIIVESGRGYSSSPRPHSYRS